MKVYLINLDKDVDRLRGADSQLKRLDVEYERFPAVYAKTLDEEILEQAVDKFRWWCVLGRPVSLGEIGCALSHYSLYERIIKDDEPACILEDDVALDARFKEMLEFAGSEIQCARPQVILLSNHTRCKGGSQKELVRCTADMFAEGYLITPIAAKVLLSANMPMQCPCDHWGRWVKVGLIELYHAFPTVCSQNVKSFESNTTGGRMRVTVANLGVIGWTCHKFKRIIGKTIDWVLCYLPSSIGKACGYGRSAKGF